MAAGHTIHSLDLLRVAAACGVMGAHFTAHVHARLGFDLAWIDRLNFVDLFFVLSGFLLASIYRDRIETGESFARFLQARLARLYPLHAVVACAFAIVGIALHGFGFSARQPSTFDASLLPSHLSLTQAWNGDGRQGLNFPSWSLSAEFFLLLMLPLLLMVGKRAGYRGLILLALVCALGFHGLNVHRGLPHWTSATSQMGNLRALPFFILGMAAAEFARAYASVSLSWRIPGLLALASIIGIVLDWPHEISLALFPLLIVSLALAERRHAPELMTNPMIARLSKLTYGVFLLHTMFGILLIQIVKWLELQSPGAIVILLLALMPVTFMAAAITNHLIEKPCEALLRPAKAGENAVRPAFHRLVPRFAGLDAPALAISLAFFLAQRLAA